jgi:hypothetical protein
MIHPSWVVQDRNDFARVFLSPSPETSRNSFRQRMEILLRPPLGETDVDRDAHGDQDSMDSVDDFEEDMDDEMDSDIENIDEME